MDVILKPNPLKGSVHVVSSKSMSHRYVIAAGLAQGTSIIKNVLASKDLEATKKALEGLNVQFNQNEITSGALQVKTTEVDCNESGSTLRFMVPLYMTFDQVVVFKGHGRLSDRPMDVYKEAFNEQEVLFESQDENKSLPLKVKGPLKGCIYRLKGDVSSQFLTGLLFALPLLEANSVIELTTPLSSKGYVDMTLDTLALFGINYKVEDQKILIPGNQSYEPRNLDVEGDFSQAAFWMVAATINKYPLALTALNPASLQGDKKIIDIINQMGGSVRYNHHMNQYEVLPQKTKGITIDLDPIPDLGPILMVLAALSEGETHFINCSRLKLKESDRLQVMHDVLTDFGVDMKITADEAWIKGQEKLKGDLTFDSYNDHRIVMAIAIASLKADGIVTIKHAEHIEKSYPNFFEVFKNLGGDVDEIR